MIILLCLSLTGTLGAVLLMAIGLVLAMGIFIKVCAVHTPSSNC